MNYPLALVLTVAMVCGTLLTVRNASSQGGSAVDTYRAIATGSDRVFVVETTTGRVASCAGSQDPTCGAFSDPPRR